MDREFNPRKIGKDIDRARRTYGGRDWPASFADRLTAPLPTFRDMLRVARQGGFTRTDLSGAERVPVRSGPLPALEPGQAGVTWVGHASFVLRVGGLTVLTDPVWSEKIPGIRPRLTPPGVAWADLPRIDAVVISHNHYDHLDAPTIRRLGRDTPVFVPGMLGWWFRRRGFRRVTELDWWESARLAEVDFEFVPAHHWSRRTPADGCKSLWGGWLLRTGGTSVYFAGDSGYGHRFAEIGARHPGIDLALLPVGAYEPNWFMASSHLNPEEAVRACLDTGARRIATMHWGTFVLSAEPLLEPVERTRRAWQAAGRPAEDLWDLAVGESRALPVREPDVAG